jgi:hypothetical protein
MAEAGGERGRWLIAVAVAVSVLVAATGGWIVGRVTDSAAAASVTLVSADTPGPDPFTRSVSINESGEFPSNVRAVAASLAGTLTPDPQTNTLEAVGTTPGLYGGSGESRVCDPARLVAFLRDSPAKARAWARVFGIQTSAIANYVAQLTPVLLTHDTVVTNHGFRDGQANAFQAVLQAGTAVLVDSTGTPRVKCNCGNPLSPPAAVALADADTVGRSWAGYRPNAVTRIQPGPAATNLTLVDTTTGDTFTTPTGTGPNTGDTNGSSDDEGDLNGFDFRNAKYLDRVCGTEQQVQVTNGEWLQYREQFNMCGFTIRSVDYADVTGDGRGDAIVAIDGNASGTVRGQRPWTVIFRGGGKTPVEIAAFDGTFYPPVTAGAGVTVWQAIAGELGCCPSAYKKTTYTYDRATRTFVVSNETSVPPEQLPQQ